MLRPSGSHAWRICYGYERMNAGRQLADEEQDDTIREEGAAAHWLAQSMAHGQMIAEGTLAPNGVAITDEMIDGVTEYLHALAAWGIPVNIERTMRIPSIREDMEGTPDAWAYDAIQKLLRLADLKFGYRYVDVFENPQLLCYAEGLIHEFNLNDLDLWVEFTIYQPRTFHRDGALRTWRVRASDLRPLINELKHAAAMSAMPDAVCVVNPGCQDCAARHVCQTLQNAALGALEYAYKAVPHDLPPVALGDELRRLERAQKMLEARITGLQTEAINLLRKGAIIPQYQYTHGVGREAWVSPEAEAQVIGMAKLFNKDIRKPEKPITPTQARKVLPERIVSMFSHRPPTAGKLTLMNERDIRKAFSRGK